MVDGSNRQFYSPARDEVSSSTAHVELHSECDGAPQEPPSERECIDRLAMFVKRLAVKRAETDGPLYQGVSGETYAWLLVFHDFFLEVEALDEFSELFWKRFSLSGPLQVGGMETSGIPLVLAVVRKGRELGHTVNGFFIRKQRKLRGLARSIDGKLTDAPVVLIDDVFKSGETMERARVAVEQAGGLVTHICCVVGFDWSSGAEWLAANRIKGHIFLNLDDLDLVDGGDCRTDDSDKRAVAKISYEPLWHFAAPGANPAFLNPKSTPLVDENRIFMGSDAGVLWCLDALTGDAIWEYDCKVRNPKGIWSCPAAHGEFIYFGAYNGNVYSLNKYTGEERWVTPACQWVGSSPVIVGEHGIVVLGMEYSRENWTGGIAALDLESGEKIWEHQLQGLQHGSAAYWSDGDLLIAGSSDHALIGLKAGTGELVWESKTNRSIKYPPFICDKRGLAASGSHDGGIRLHNLATGELLFEHFTDDICYTTPLIEGKFLFCGSGDSCFYIFDIEQLCLARVIETRGRIYSAPVLYDGNVIFGNAGGVVEEIDSETFETQHAITCFRDFTSTIIAISC